MSQRLRSVASFASIGTLAAIPLTSMTLPHHFLISVYFSKPVKPPIIVRTARQRTWTASKCVGGTSLEIEMKMSKISFRTQSQRRIASSYVSTPPHAPTTPTTFKTTRCSKSFVFCRQTFFLRYNPVKLASPGP